MQKKIFIQTFVLKKYTHKKIYDKINIKKVGDIVAKKKEEKFSKKELIITILVLIVCIIVGVLGGKALYEAMYGSI